MTSQARIEANRRNAQKSTGPRTIEGKKRSCLNALDHGLRAEHVVLPTEDTSAFDAHMVGWIGDWQPTTRTRLHLVKRVAVATWRLDRCVRVETARLSDRANVALYQWDSSRADRVARAVDRLDVDPAAAVRDLESTREGLSKLSELWRGIDLAAREPGAWNDPEEHHQRFFLLQGLHTNDPGAKQAVDNLWRFLLVARPDLVEEDEVGPFEPRLAEKVREQIQEYADQEIGRLIELWNALPDESLARNRFAELAAFTPRPEDATLLRYEAQFDREFRASINQLVKLTQTGADLVEDPLDAPNEPIIPTIEAPEASPVPNEPNAEPVAEPSVPNEPIMVMPTLPVARADRDRKGRTWPLVESPEGSDLPQSLGSNR